MKINNFILVIVLVVFYLWEGVLNKFSLEKIFVYDKLCHMLVS